MQLQRTAQWKGKLARFVGRAKRALRKVLANQTVAGNRLSVGMLMAYRAGFVARGRVSMVIMRTRLATCVVPHMNESTLHD